MTSMIIFREGYDLVVLLSNVRKPFQVMDHSRDCVAKKGTPTELGRCMNTWKGVTRFLKGLRKREGKTGE